MNAENKYNTLAKVVYYKNGMTLAFLTKWKWYFKYREALLRINNPKAFIEYSSGSYDYELPSVLYKKKVYNKLISAKRKVTEFTRKLDNLRLSWQELFPIEQDPRYSNTINKLKEYQEKKADLELAYNKIKDEE